MAKAIIDSDILEIIDKNIIDYYEKIKLIKYIEDKIYFGSDLNEYVNRFLPVTFFLINMDVIRWKERDRHLLLAEYKHDNEELAKSQKRILPVLSSICTHTCNKVRTCSERELINIKSNVILIKGNLPKTKEEREQMFIENKKIVFLFDFDTRQSKELTLKELDELILSENGKTNL